MTVIVVIAIGVGVLAATTNPRVYGPSWGRFMAAFGGRCTCTSSTYQHICLTNGFPTSGSLFSDSTDSSPWVGYVPVPGGIALFPSDVLTVSVEKGVPKLPSDEAVLDAARAIKSGVTFTKTVPEDTEDTNGLSVVTIGPECPNGQCRAILLVSNGRTLWDVLAIATGPVSRVESFLASFEPIG